jgi:spore germination cell wall hydrolase CwlJ-like protein
MTRTGVIIIAFTIALALLTAILIMAQFGAPLPLDKLPEPLEPIEPMPPEPEPYQYITPAERELIARVCHTEARGEGMVGMMAVAEVILNRLYDGRFGATIADICVAREFHGLNQSVSEIAQGAYMAVDSVFKHGNYAGTNRALYFCTNNTNPDRIKKGLRKVAEIMNHSFYTD